MSSLTLGKQERLSSKKQIDLLFQHGSTFQVPSFRILWLKDGPADESTFQILFSISKRTFPKAVDRNRIRRLMRESFRLQKALLLDFLQNTDRRCLIAIIFVGREIPGFTQMKSKINVALQRLIREMEHNTSIGSN